MTIIGIIIVFSLLLLLGYALYDLATQSMARRTKLAWLLIIILLPFAGAIVYLVRYVGMSGPTPQDRLPDTSESDIELERLRGF